MVRNSVSDSQLRQHWERAQTTKQAYLDYSIQRNAPPGLVGALFGALKTFNKALELAANSDPNSSEYRENLQENIKKISADPIRVEKQFQQLLARQINLGRKIAIGFKKSENRQDVRFVWDGPIESNGLDLINGEYRGPNLQFCDVCILDRADCDEKVREKFDRLRDGKKGRPQFASIPIAIDRVFLRYPDLDNPNFIKRASEKIILAISEMRKSGETNEEPEESTIQGALRKRWKNPK